MKISSKYQIIAYHCPNCGGATDPMDGTCKYCDSKIFLREYQGKLKQRQVRIMIDCGEDYIYFDRIMSLQQQIFDDSYSYRDIDGCLHRVQNNHKEMDVNITLDNRGLGLLKKIDLGKIYDTRMEFLAADKAVEMKVYLPKFEINSIDTNAVATANLNFISASETKIFNGLVPEDANCPNCGAPVKSKYGCCDWCGGWLEYTWD